MLLFRPLFSNHRNFHRIGRYNYTAYDACLANEADRLDLSLFRIQKFESQDEYYYTTFNSALNFIEDLSLKDLTIDKEEFYQALAIAEEKEIERYKTVYTVNKSNI